MLCFFLCLVRHELCLLCAFSCAVSFKLGTNYGTHTRQRNMTAWAIDTCADFYFLPDPGFWRMQDKIGMGLDEIHFSGNVPQCEFLFLLLWRSLLGMYFSCLHFVFGVVGFQFHCAMFFSSLFSFLCLSIFHLFSFQLGVGL